MSTRKGLHVSIYRSGGDCSNGGVTSKAQNGILFGIGVPAIFEPSADTPALELKERYGRQIAVPVDDPRMHDGNHAGPMFGGNFVYSSDSRFPSEQPIHVHDRFETGMGPED